MGTPMIENSGDPFDERRSFSLGKYYLFARLGAGGMAEVFLGVARGAMNVTRLAVVKRLRDEHANDPMARDMFLNEARLAARLNHPNVIQTFEAGSEGGCYFIAMEYVDGQPLSRILRRLKRKNRVLEPRVAARIAADALEGLHHAHELSDFDGTPLCMIHRDVSPQNIMITYDGWVKVLDFGIAKAVGTSHTAHGVFKGKVAFMAPEQLLGESVDRRADLFAMGICLWEAVTGARLMAEDTPAKTLLNLINKDIPFASDVNSAVPIHLSNVIAKALQRDPVNRYATAREMRDALENYVAKAGGVTPDEVGDVTSHLFAETRASLQAQIKARVASLSVLQNEPGAHDFGSTQIRSMGGTALVDLSDAPDPSASTLGSAAHAGTFAGHSRISTTPSSWGRRLAMMLGALGAIAALAAGSFAYMHFRPAPIAAPAVAPAPAAPIPSSAPEDPQPVPVAAQSAGHATPNDPEPRPTANAVGRPATVRTVRAPSGSPPASKPATAASAAAQTSAAPEPANAPSAVPPASAKPTDPPQGRIFRRQL